MKRSSDSSYVMLVLAVVLMGVGAFAPGCDRKEAPPGQTRLRSGETTREWPRGDEPRRVDDAASATAEPSPTATTRATEPAAAPPRSADAELERRFDAGRLSIIGSAEERERNLGVIRNLADAAAVPPPAEPAPAPQPQMGAGAVESPPPARAREGAGRPGAGGAPYQ